MHTRKECRWWWAKQNYHCLHVETKSVKEKRFEQSGADARPIVWIRSGCFRPHGARWLSPVCSVVATARVSPEVFDEGSEIYCGLRFPPDGHWRRESRCLSTGT